jgi:glycosyltransferase involved in cell wall biosynthesis
VASRALAILHVMRAPVGGLFRHVCDLARGQSARGHLVGILADATTGGERAAAVLADLGRELALGVTRVAMSRDLGVSDWAAFRATQRLVAELDIDIVHGHGAKGGAYARLAGAGRVRVYTPHGGSLHYARSSPVGFAYLTLEQILARRTELFLFESAYGERVFAEKVGKPSGLVRVVHNGVAPVEFEPVEPAPDATDLLFVGELRALKGVDVLLRAMAALKAGGRPLGATLVGAGPDADRFRALAAELGLGDRVRFPGALPARQAFAMGRLMVVPSRAESLPYIVLEAGAAGLPLIATAVGGMAEILGADAGLLVAPGDADALAAAIVRRLDDPAATADAAARLRSRIAAGFSVAAMTDGVLAGYQEALAIRQRR